MQVDEIEVVRVFPARDFWDNEEVFTHFGFQTKSLTVEHASFYGAEAFDCGKLLIVRSPENEWKKIYGWMNLETGEIHESSFSRGGLWVVLIVVVVVVVRAVRDPDRDWGFVGAWPVTLLLLLYITHGVREEMRKREAKKIMVARRRELKLAPKRVRPRT